MRGRVVQTHPRVVFQQFLHLGSAMAQVVDDAMQIQVGCCLSVRSHQNDTRFSERVELVTYPATSPSCTFRRANNTTVPLRSYSNFPSFHLPGLGRQCRVDLGFGLNRGFSFTDHTTAFA